MQRADGDSEGRGRGRGSRDESIVGVAAGGGATLGADRAAEERGEGNSGWRIALRRTTGAEQTGVRSTSQCGGAHDDTPPALALRQCSPLFPARMLAQHTARDTAADDTINDSTHNNEQGRATKQIRAAVPLRSIAAIGERNAASQSEIGYATTDIVGIMRCCRYNSFASNYRKRPQKDRSRRRSVTAAYAASTTQADGV